VTSTLQLHKFCNILNSGRETVGFGIRATRGISLLAVRFLV
jgi:hypothetical protein